MTRPGGWFRFLKPDVNVSDGDRLARIGVTLLVTVLTVLTLPVLQVPYPLLKISLLCISELGLVALLLGMFLESPTWFAGVELLVAPLIILGFTSHGLAWVGAAVGALFIGAGISGIITRRSWLNALLRLPPVQQVPEAARTEPGRSQS